MFEEFEKLTGVELTYAEYAGIEKEYMESSLDKRVFCKKWLENNGAERLYKTRTETIEKQLKEIQKLESDIEKNKTDYEKKIQKLQEKLDKELEWRDTTGIGTQMDKNDYVSLMSSGTVLDDDKAKQLIADEFGFSYRKIEIVKEVHTYEVNKYGYSRKKETLTREPVYCATDWNYVRFNVCNWFYEMINGELNPYYC